MRSAKDRIPAAERREQILAAATTVFGERGYAGATTDQVARAAGISQPYVVRMFGTKEQLFVEVVESTCAKIRDTFRSVIDSQPGAEATLTARIAASYVGLIEDRGILLSVMQGFIMGSDPRIGAVAREGFMSIYRVLRDEAGFSPDEVRQFLANGMLINTLMASGLVDDLDSNPDAAELFACAFGEKLQLVVGQLHAGNEKIALIP